MSYFSHKTFLYILLALILGYSGPAAACVTERDDNGVVKLIRYSVKPALQHSDLFTLPTEIMFNIFSFVRTPKNTPGKTYDYDCLLPLAHTCQQMFELYDSYMSSMGKPIPSRGDPLLGAVHLKLFEGKEGYYQRTMKKILGTTIMGFPYCNNLTSLTLEGCFDVVITGLPKNEFDYFFSTFKLPPSLKVLILNGSSSTASSEQSSIKDLTDGLTQLTEKNLRRNPFLPLETVEIKNHIWTAIDPSAERFQRALRQFFNNLPNLTKVNLSHNEMANPFLKSLVKENKHSLSVSEVKHLMKRKEDPIVRELMIQQSSRREYFEPGGLQWKGINPQEYDLIWGLALPHQWEVLNLSHNKIGGEEGGKLLGDVFFSQLNLRSVNLSHNHLDERSMEFLGDVLISMSHLHHLDLSNNLLGQNGLFWLSHSLHATNLRSLNLSSTGIRLFSTIGGIPLFPPFIKELNLANNNLDDADMKVLERFLEEATVGYLEEVNLENNPNISQKVQENLQTKFPDIRLTFNRKRKLEVIV